MSVASVNLLWQHRYRGLLAVAQHNVADDGRVLLIKPDEFERRTYQLLDVQPDGSTSEAGAISVETIQKFDGLAGGRFVAGITADDLYLFRDGKKLRFMPDRRVTYTDVHVAPDTGWFACSFSDSVFSTHGLAFGDANGRLGWTKDLRTPPNRVALTADGHVVVAGLQNGQLLAMDQMRTPLWECYQEEPISALALPASGARPVAATEAGTVLAVDEDGGFRWRTTVGIPVIAVATDREAQWAAAVCSNESSHLVTCFGADGSPVWEYALETRPTGVSLSPNGQYLLISCAQGGAVLFQVDFSRATLGAGRPRGRDVETARAAAAVGDLRHARELLLPALEETPHDLPLARELAEIETAWLERLRREAHEHAEDGRLLDALQTLEEAAAAFPWDADLFQERLEYRCRALLACRENAAALEQAREWEAARAAWLSALRLDPGAMDIREALGRLCVEQARELMLAGDQHETFGDLDSALAHWQQALALNDAEELRARLLRAEVCRCVAAGILFYEAQRMPEAAFQFRKALALDPTHEDARRYLGYIEGLSGDSGIADRFAHLE